MKKALLLIAAAASLLGGCDISQLDSSFGTPKQKQTNCGKVESFPVKVKTNYQVERDTIKQINQVFEADIFEESSDPDAIVIEYKDKIDNKGQENGFPLGVTECTGSGAGQVATVTLPSGIMDDGWSTVPLAHQLFHALGYKNHAPDSSASFMEDSNSNMTDYGRPYIKQWIDDDLFEDFDKLYPGVRGSKVYQPVIDETALEIGGSEKEQNEDETIDQEEIAVDSNNSGFL